MYEDPTVFRWGVVSMGVVGLLLTIALGCWLCEKHIPQMLLAKYKAQSPMAKFVAAVALVLATWFGGAKPSGGGSSDPGAGDPPMLQMSGFHGGTILLSQGVEDQPSVITNRMSVVRFGVDNDAHELNFGLSWTDGFWELLNGNRTIDIFMSTNLLNRCWTLINNRSMPYYTNAYDFAIGRYDVPYDFRDLFDGSFSDKAFFSFGTRFDGDGDGLTDAEEEFVYGTSPVRADTDFDGLTDYDECRYYGTDPRNPDSDGDGVWDGDERYQGSDPLLADSDADGLTDAEEARYCHSYRLPLWLEGDGQVEVLNAPSAIVQDEVWSLTLPNAVSLAGRAYSNLVVDVNGVLYLSQNPVGVTSSNHPQYMWNTGWNCGEIAIAPFWSDLVLRPSQDASVSLKTNANGDSIVEFVNVGFSDPNYADRTVSFQVVLSPSATNRVIVAYKGMDRTVIDYVSPTPRCGFRVDNGLFADDRYEQLYVESGDSYHILHFGYGTDCYDSDSDGDQLSDYDELFVYHTDPTRWTDSDGDGLSDGKEMIVHHTNPNLADTDGDGVEDGDEVRDGFDPLVDESDLDTDGDGVLDFDEEYDYYTDRFEADTDGDGLDDFEEIFENETDPRHPDTDRDGISDFDEVVTYGTDPLRADTDGDSLPDAWEIACGLDPLSDEDDDGALGDPDGDGITNVREYGLGTNPNAVDSDGDGLRDDEEVGTFERSPGPAVAFDCSGGVNLLPASSDNYDDNRFAVPLPFPVTVAGMTATSMVVSVNGIVGLISTNDQGRSWGPSYGNSDLASYTVDSYHATIAAYWDDLKAYAAQGASIRVADVGVGDDRCCVIEYRNIGIQSGGYSAANSATFQIVIPSVVTNGIYVQYLQMDGSFDGSGATVGMQVSDRMSIPVSCNSQGCPLAGDRIVFHVGTCTNPANPDTDDDKLNDGDEVDAGTSPFQKDTDGDGLSDAWEHRYGLDPLSADGVNGADGDFDGDGLANAFELAAATAPNESDTDDDGLNDLIEAGGFLRTNPLPWFDMTAATDLTASFEGSRERLVNIQHSGMTVIRNVAVSNIVLTANGMLYLRRTGNTSGVYSGDYADSMAGYTRDKQSVCISPFGTDFDLTVTNEPASRISTGVFSAGGTTYRVIEYANMWTSFYVNYSYIWQRISFQVAIPYGETDRVYVRYAERSGSLMDGRNASVGFQGWNGYNRRSFCHREEGKISSGTALAMVIGTGSNPNVQDSDNDGLSDFEEVTLRSNPLQSDTDGDGMNDGWENENGFDPTVNNNLDDDPDNDRDEDPDGDGLTNGQECDWNTDPFETDSDNDGVDDGDEVGQFSDPDDATDRGRPASRVPVTFTFGDHSGSHSEKYRLELTPVAPRNRTVEPAEMPKSVSWVDAEYGECETKTAMLARGFDYELRMYHAGTNEEDSPDYDYSLVISYPPTVGVITNDPSGLINADDMTSDYFSGEGKVATITVLDAGIYADYDRDGKIDENDRAKLYAGRKLRHWVNDDDDDGDVSPDPDSDVPGAQTGLGERDGRDPDWDEDSVEGRCDLLDFAPIRLDIGGMLDQLEGGLSDYEFRLVQSAGAIKVVWTSLSSSEAGAFLTENVTGCGRSLNQNAHEARVADSEDDGAVIPIPSSVINLIRNDHDRGVILIEGCAETTSPLVFECRRASDDELVFKVEMPLSVSEVGKMFRMKNLRPVCGDNGEFTERLGVPGNNPDTETNQKNLIFLHGANVTREGATAWFSEVFKRLWQSGVNVKFHGVTWHSDKGSDANYQENVSNAFVTASSLASYVNGLSGQRTIMAHSLGNMVVSSAIKDHGMQIYKYLMCNSAVPSEAYYAPEDISIRIPQLVHEDWEEYPTNSWASNWHKLFGNSPNDGRSKLGWPGRFSGVLANAVNFYSTGDEVLEISSDNDVSIFTGIGDGFGHLSWHKQELFKGRGGLGGTDWSGWSIRKHLLVFADITPEEANGMTDADFKTNTVFRLEPANMNSSALTRLQADAHLAQGIPALAPATGRSDLSLIMSDGRNVDMNAYADGQPWPSRSGHYASRWLHSDMKDVAFLFNHALYQLIIEKGGLQ